MLQIKGEIQQRLDLPDVDRLATRLRTFQYSVVEALGPQMAWLFLVIVIG
jgi:hypothetical protein